MSALVEESCRRSGSGPLSSSAAMALASTLPSSTPHWSKESMPQIDALREHAVLVERDQRARGSRASAPRARIVLVGPVALERLVRARAPSGVPSAAHLLGRPAEGQRLGLREHVGDEQVVVVAQRVERPGEADEVARGRAACPGGSAGRSCAGRSCPARPSTPGRSRSRRASPSSVTDLPLRLHRQLLEVGREPLQVLVVGQHGDRRRRRRSRRTRP